MKKTTFFLFLLILTALFITACNEDDKPVININTNTKTTFQETSDNLCTIDGKPVIRMFSTTWCPHCIWAKDPFENAVKEYEGKIIAYHWEIDIGDNTLTETIETEIPEEETNLLKKYNPKGSIPTFVFGCKYLRIGTGHETENNKEAEKQEFIDIIEKLLQEA